MRSIWSFANALTIPTCRKLAERKPSGKTLWINWQARGRWTSCVKCFFADSQLKGIWDKVDAVLNAPDILDRPIVSQSTPFINRLNLRTELRTLATSASVGVLLVRGENQSGRSWTRHLVYEYATEFDENFIYIGSGVVATLQDTLNRLFDKLNASPPVLDSKLTTEKAWFRKVCNEAQKSRRQDRNVPLGSSR